MVWIVCAGSKLDRALHKGVGSLGTGRVWLASVERCVLFADEQNIQIIKGSLEDLTERILEHYNQAAVEAADDNDERSSSTGRVVTPASRRKIRRGRPPPQKAGSSPANLVTKDGASGAGSSERKKTPGPPRRDIRSFVPSKRCS